MRTFAKAASALLGAVLSVSAAQAADIIDYPPIIETPEVIPLDVVGGWYLRGDIGYKFYRDPDVSLNPHVGSVTDTSMDDTGLVGVGIGYQFNDYLRADLTSDYEFKSGFKGTFHCVTNCGGFVSAEAETDIDAWTTMVNVYADLGTYHGITPYVGAGIGATYLRTSTVTSPGVGDIGEGDSEWNFAWALTAGASYALTEQLSLDLNYRYLNLGEAKTGDTFTACGCVTKAETDKLQAHEIRLGLRYAFY